MDGVPPTDSSAPPAAAAIAAPARPVLRGLMWLHLAYLLAIPVAGMAAITATRTATVLDVAGWVPAVVYAATIIRFYQLDGRLWLALLIVLLAPAQVAYHALWLHGGVGGYVIEESFVELIGLTIALTIVMIAYRPSGWAGAAVGVAMAAVAALGWGWPLYQRYRAAHADRLAWLLLGVVVATATWQWTQLAAPYASGELSPDQPPGAADADLDIGVSDIALFGWIVGRSRVPPMELSRAQRERAAPVVIIVITLGWFAVVGLVELLAR